MVLQYVVLHLTNPRNLAFNGLYVRSCNLSVHEECYINAGQLGFIIRRGFCLNYTTKLTRVRKDNFSHVSYFSAVTFQKCD